MSLNNLKKKVTQNDLRRVMNEHKKKLTTVTKIESPIAKYPFLEKNNKIHINKNKKYIN